MVLLILSVADAAACSDDASLSARVALGSKLIAPHPAISGARDREKAAKKAAAAPAPIAPPPVPLRAGDRVTHAKFGGGEVRSVHPNGNLAIRFDDASRRRWPPPS